MSLLCPVCGGNTRAKGQLATDNSVVRSRVCKECGYTFKTEEITQEYFRILEERPPRELTESIMTPNKYQKLALRTESKKYENDNTMRLVNASLGLGGESGEFEDCVKKHVFQDHELDPKHLTKELGDIMWYVAQAADALGYPLEEIMEANIHKLKKRYPDGFEKERSLRRKPGDD